MNKSHIVSVLIIISFFVASCYSSATVKEQESSNGKNRDSVYVIIDSLTVNKRENTFDKFWSIK